MEAHALFWHVSVHVLAAEAIHVHVEKLVQCTPLQLQLQAHGISVHKGRG